MKENNEYMLPPMDVVLDILNEQPGAAVHILAFYEPYVLKMSRESYFDADGNRIGYRVNEDLAQEIRIALFKSLPKARQAVISKFFDNDESDACILLDKS